MHTQSTGQNRFDCQTPNTGAYELVEDGKSLPATCAPFAFTSAVKLWGTRNPRFFEGTCVANGAAAVLATAQSRDRSAAPTGRLRT